MYTGSSGNSPSLLFINHNPSMCTPWVTQHTSTRWSNSSHIVCVCGCLHLQHVWSSAVGEHDWVALVHSCENWGEHRPVAECNHSINFWNRTILLLTACSINSKGIFHVFIYANSGHLKVNVVQICVRNYLHIYHFLKLSRCIGECRLDPGIPKYKHKINRNGQPHIAASLL
jgi:hypothetical protein